MSFVRKIGFAIQQASGDQETSARLCAELGISKQELQKLYKGRLFLTGADLDKVAEVCGISVEALMDTDSTDYDAQVVHCMTKFQNCENREMILDLIDAYIDAKEALATRI